MKSTMFLILFFIVLSLVFTGMILAQGKGPAAKGASVWDYLRKAGFAKSWKMWPGTTAMYQESEPHGAFLTTYVNDTALKSINAKKGKFADGSIIAQENYS